MFTVSRNGKTRSLEKIHDGFNGGKFIRGSEDSGFLGFASALLGCRRVHERDRQWVWRNLEMAAQQFLKKIARSRVQVAVSNDQEEPRSDSR